MIIMKCYSPTRMSLFGFTNKFISGKQGSHNPPVGIIDEVTNRRPGRDRTQCERRLG